MVNAKNPCLPRVVRDGARVLRFDAAVIGAATSERSGAPRWSELVIYRLPEGRYIVSKIGHSVIAHRENCPRVGKRNWRMLRWIDAGPEEAQIHRVPCPECLPMVTRGIDPQTLLEETRYRVTVAEDYEGLLATLTEGRAFDSLPQLVTEVLRQAYESDSGLMRYTSALSPGLTTFTS